MPMKYACNSAAHVSRRAFLGGSMTGALGMLGFNGMVQASAAKKIASQQKRAVVFWLGGGVSQLETWDPKPGTDTGGPFRAISTSAPGVQISELLPHTAKVMHHFALVRGINTRQNNHGKGARLMQYGRKVQPGFDYPHLGSAFSAVLRKPDNPLPGYIAIGRGGSAKQAAFLGPRHAPVLLRDGKAPDNLDLPAGLSESRDARRRKLRRKIGKRFALGRRGANTEVYDQSYDQAAALMAKKGIFDFSKFSSKDLARYGKHDFGRHCLLARRLLENGVSFVQVTHTNYDTHYENFDFHIEQLGEFDKPFSSLVQDLADRGRLDSTLIVVMSEFGRTPRINANFGRDHWGTAWSVVLGGCGIQHGAVVGKTNKNGTAVAERQVDHSHLFHTYLQAVGIDSEDPVDIGGRPIPLADPASAPIKELLA
ncbi:MAG: DUF1501 domain-containing protein [Planctomycetes bacterium]|nr:DUF1501 domain-containing protein [Planctomycetota bacterium]